MSRVMIAVQMHACVGYAVCYPSMIQTPAQTYDNVDATQSVVGGHLAAHAIMLVSHSIQTDYTGAQL